MMAAVILTAGNGYSQTSDLEGQMLSSKSGIEVASGEHVLPAIVRSYAPQLGAAELWAGPEELKSKAVNQELLGRVIYAVAAAARGQGVMGQKLWVVIWLLFGAVSVGAGMWTFSKIGNGRMSTDDGMAFVLRFFAAFVILKWAVGFVPNASISSLDWLTEGLASVGSSSTATTTGQQQQDEVNKAFALKLISAVKVQAGENARSAAAQVILNATATPAGATLSKGDEDTLRAKYYAVFLDGFFRLGDSKFDDADAFAAAAVEAAKKGEFASRQGWQGFADSAKNLSDSLNPILGVGKLLFGSSEQPWEQKSLEEQRAVISQVIGNSTQDAFKGLALAIKEDLVRGDADASAGKGDYFERAKKMSMGDIMFAHQNIFRKLGNSFTAQPVDKKALEASFAWLNFALRIAAFELGVMIWLMPFIFAASAIGLPLGVAHLRAAVKSLAFLFIAAATVAFWGEWALASMISRVTGSTKAIDAGSWLALIGNFNIEMIVYAALIVISPPVVAGIVVRGTTAGISAIGAAMNPGGMAGQTTGGGWVSAAGKSIGIGGSGSGPSLWDRLQK